MASCTNDDEDVITDPTTLGEIAQDQGTFEMAVVFPDKLEADLYTEHTDCSKNPTHDGFIPVSSFTKTDLLGSFKGDDDVYKAVNLLANLTVRIRAKKISKKRANTKLGLGTHKQIPYAKYAGRSAHRFGTGSVIYSKIVKINNTLCPCDECEASSSPSKVWGRITVLTAKHVIFDMSEAKDCKVELFYDDDTTRKDSVVILKGYCFLPSKKDALRDSCQLGCISHDVDLIEKLAKTAYECSRIFGYLTSLHTRTEFPLAVVVSHPHGCSKKVSLGQWTEKEECKEDGGNEKIKYIYTASTCQGSSGAPVFLIGGWGVGQDWSGILSRAFHSDSVRRDCNKSGHAMIYDLSDIHGGLYEHSLGLSKPY